MKILRATSGFAKENLKISCSLNVSFITSFVITDWTRLILFISRRCTAQKAPQNGFFQRAPWSFRGVIWTRKIPRNPNTGRTCKGTWRWRGQNSGEMFAQSSFSFSWDDTHREFQVRQGSHISFFLMLKLPFSFKFSTVPLLKTAMILVEHRLWKMFRGQAICSESYELKRFLDNVLYYIVTYSMLQFHQVFS